MYESSEVVRDRVYGMGRKSLGCEIDPFGSPAGRLSVFASRSGYNAGAMIAWTSGTRLGPYELLTALGAGGMGEVWKALDTRIDRTVAITRLKSEYGERFRSEACAIAALSHPHICQLYDVGPDYLVME